ncbi:MAG: hypothetical protein AAFY88_10570, partial [Acidobacteriota bacterium]
AEAPEGSSAAASLPELHLTADGGDGRWRLDGRSPVFEALRAELDPGGARVEVEGLQTAAAQLRGFGVDALDATVTLEAIRSASNAPAVALAARVERVTMADGGTWSLPGAALDLTAELADGGRWPVDASVELPTLGGTAMPAALAEWLPLALPASVGAEGELVVDGLLFSGDVRLRSPALGGVALSGDLPASPGAAGLDAGWRLDLAAGALRNLIDRIELPAKAAVTAPGLRARGRVRGSVAAPELSGAVTLDALEVDATASYGASFRGPLSADFRAAPTDGGWRIDATRIDAGGSVATSLVDALPVAIRGALRARVGGESPRIDVRSLDAKLGADGTLGAIGVTGGLDGGRLQLAFSATDFSIGAWQRTLNIGRGDVEVKGTAGLDGQLDSRGGAPEDAAMRATGTLRLDDVGASAMGGARVAEGLGGHFDVTASRSPEDGRLRAEARGELGGFLVLWDAYFGDLTELTTGVEAHLTTGDGGDFTAGVDLRPQTAGRSTALSAELGRAGDRLRAAGTFTSTDLLDLRGGLLRPFQTDAPLLRHLAGSATLRAELDVAAPGASGPGADEVRFSGRFTARGADVELADAVLRDLHADLPFDLRRRAGAVNGPALEGELRLGASTVGGLKVPPLRSVLDIRGDGVALLDPLELDLLGGQLKLERLALRNLLIEPTAEAGVQLAGLSMERLTASLGLPALEGQLDGLTTRIESQDLAHTAASTNEAPLVR